MLTEEQCTNILAMLGRVQLQGDEALAYVDAKVALEKQLEELKTGEEDD